MHQQLNLGAEYQRACSGRNRSGVRGSTLLEREALQCRRGGRASISEDGGLSSSGGL